MIHLLKNRKAGAGLIFAFLMFLIMIVAALVYLYVTGEFAELKFIDDFVASIGTTKHDLGMFLAISIIVAPFVLIPLVIIIMKMLNLYG